VQWHESHDLPKIHSVIFRRQFTLCFKKWLINSLFFSCHILVHFHLKIINGHHSTAEQSNWILATRTVILPDTVLFGDRKIGSSMSTTWHSRDHSPSHSTARFKWTWSRENSLYGDNEFLAVKGSLRYSLLGKLSSYLLWFRLFLHIAVPKIGPHKLQFWQRRSSPSMLTAALFVCSLAINLEDFKHGENLFGHWCLKLGCNQSIQRSNEQSSLTYRTLDRILMPRQQCRQ